MSEPIYAHEVIKMLMESSNPFTEEDFEKTIKERFGERVIFRTCSRMDLTPREVIAFLEEKGKFTTTPEGFLVPPDTTCL